MAQLERAGVPGVDLAIPKRRQMLMEIKRQRQQEDCLELQLQLLPEVSLQALGQPRHQHQHQHQEVSLEIRHQQRLLRVGCLEEHLLAVCLEELLRQRRRRHRQEGCLALQPRRQRLCHLILTNQKARPAAPHPTRIVIPGPGRASLESH